MSASRSVRHTAGASLVVALLLSACATSVEPAVVTPEVTPLPQVTTSPEPVDTASPATDDAVVPAAKPTLNVYGLGDVAHWSMTPDEFAAALGKTFTPTDFYAESRRDFQCGYLQVDEPGWEGIAFMVTGEGEGRVMRADVMDEHWSTHRGITVGSTREEVLALQDDGISTRPSKYGDGETITVAPAEATALEVFDISETGLVQTFHAGAYDEALMVEGCS